jgi:hypothetical protein
MGKQMRKQQRLTAKCILTLVVLTVVWGVVVSFGQSTMDVDKATAVLETVNGGDEDYVRYTVKNRTYSNIQVYATVVFAVLFVTVVLGCSGKIRKEN